MIEQTVSQRKSQRTFFVTLLTQPQETDSDETDSKIEVELQMTSGPAKRITVARDEKVFHAVAERLQCRRRQLNRIEFGGTPLPPTEHLTFDSIGMEDDGRLGVDIRTEFVDTEGAHR